MWECSSCVEICCTSFCTVKIKHLSVYNEYSTCLSGGGAFMYLRSFKMLIWTVSAKCSLTTNYIYLLGPSIAWLLFYGICKHNFSSTSSCSENWSARLKIQKRHICDILLGLLESPSKPTPRGQTYNDQLQYPYSAESFFFFFPTEGEKLNIS